MIALGNHPLFALSFRRRGLKAAANTTNNLKKSGVTGDRRSHLCYSSSYSSPRKPKSTGDDDDDDDGKEKG